MLAFSPTPFVRQVGERSIFAPRPDVALMHLSHPMMQKAVNSLTRRRFPAAGESVSRWAVRQGTVPRGADALVLLAIEEHADNDLRESFHHWVRTLVFPVSGGKLGAPLPVVSARELRGATNHVSPEHEQRAQALLEDVEPDLKQHLREHGERLSEDLRTQLSLDGESAGRREEERYRSRQGEVSTLIAENTLGKLEREIDKLKVERTQGQLFDEAERLDRIDRSIEERQEEIHRRTRHYEEVRQQLDQERERILRHLLPKRHSMPGGAQVFPYVEVRLSQWRPRASSPWLTVRHGGLLDPAPQSGAARSPSCCTRSMSGSRKRVMRAWGTAVRRLDVPSRNLRTPRVRVQESTGVGNEFAGPLNGHRGDG